MTRAGQGFAALDELEDHCRDNFLRIWPVRHHRDPVGTEAARALLREYVRVMACCRRRRAFRLRRVA